MTSVLLSLPNSQSIMEEASSLLDALSGVTVAHAPFYNLSIDFHKVSSSNTHTLPSRAFSPTLTSPSMYAA